LFQEVIEVTTKVAIMTSIEEVITLLIEETSGFSFVLCGVSTNGTPTVSKILLLPRKPVQPCRN
tara:strand:+ start:802 stop:993 length:192 start_codon:yes stop_codon:yes gene_type:complete